MSNEYRRHHIVPRFIVENFLNGSAKKVTLYSKSKDKLFREYPAYALQKEYYYKSEVFDNDLEIAMGQTIENEAATIFREKVLSNNHQVKLDRSDLQTIKRFLLLQFLRTGFWTDKIESAPAFVEDRNENETPREQWLRYLKYITDSKMSKLVNEPTPYPIRFYAKIINQKTYLAFFKLHDNMEFVLPENGIIKEPASLYSFYIMPLSPKVAIVLVDTIYKYVLANPVLDDIIKKQAIDWFPRTLINTGYLEGLSENTLSHMSRVSVPLIYFEPNISLYSSPLVELAHTADYMNELFSLNVEEFNKYKNRSIKEYSRIRGLNLDNEIYYASSLISLAGHRNYSKLKRTIELMELLLISEKDARSYHQEHKNIFEGVCANQMYLPTDQYIYKIHNIEPITSIYLSYMIIEESIDQLVYTDTKKLVDVFMQEHLWKDREHPLPDLGMFKIEVKNKNQQLWNMRDMWFKTMIARSKVEDLSHLKTKIEIDY